jgi:peptide/nickel transport system ATP-binding protein
MTSLNPVRTVGSILQEVLRVRVGLDRRAARARALELLRDVGIPEPERRLGQYPFELSGGMRQRVMIALALSGEPKLLLADEPTTALDVTVQAQIMALLAELQHRHGTAIVFVTHDLSLVAGRADRIMVMYGGQVVERATTEALFRAPRMPYTRALLDAMPTIDGDPHEVLATIPGRPPQAVGPQVGCRFAPRCGRVQPRCHVDVPSLTAIDDDLTHEVACWFPLDDPSTRSGVGGAAPTGAFDRSGAESS